jgi:hypothetical protein
MDTENNHLQIRIAFAGILALVGAAFVSRLPQLLPGQQAIPWYRFGFFWAGIGIVLLALLILIVPPRRWKTIWCSVLGLPRWFRNTYYWKCYGPRCNIGEPIFKSSEISEIGHDDYEAKITASIMVWIKTKGESLRINLSSANVCLEQRVGWEQQKVPFRLYTHQVIPEIMLKPRKEWCDQILVSLICRGNRESFPDIKKRPRCGVWGISVTLPKGGTRQLHKGANCQPAHNEIIV